MATAEEEHLKEQIDYWQDLISEHLQQQSRGGHAYNPHWAPRRGSPYGVPRSRGLSRSGRGQHRHNTLVVNNATTTSATATGSSDKVANGSAQPTNQFVSTTGRHKQLINSNIYDRVTQQRTRDMDESRNAQRQAKDAREATRLQTYFAKSQPTQPDKSHELLIGPIRFRVTDGGSKLVKISNHSVDQVPRRTTVGGVNFFRSKHGNFYRAGIVKSKLWVVGLARTNSSLTCNRPIQKSPDLCPTFSSTGNTSVLRFHRRRAISDFRKEQLTDVTGSCPQGPACRYTHDPEKVAICKDFLQKGSCVAGDYCDLSHDPSPNRTPGCIHFLRGKCTNEDCRYAHIRVNPGAPVCRAFATRGYCERGSACTDRHVTECPSYANKGSCHNPSCRLPHVDRAGKLRKTAAVVSSGDLPASETVTIDDISSEGDDQPEDLDSDEDIFIQGEEGAGRDLNANQDFVGF